MKRPRLRPGPAGQPSGAASGAGPDRSIALRLADWLLSAWIVFVGIVYFGGFLWGQIGARTATFEAVYAVMLIVTALALWNRWRHRASK